MANNVREFSITLNEFGVVFVAGVLPIHVQIFHYGPFVMNTEQEIREAIQDFQSGKFGHLE